MPSPLGTNANSDLSQLQATYREIFGAAPAVPAAEEPGLGMLNMEDLSMPIFIMDHKGKARSPAGTHFTLHQHCRAYVAGDRKECGMRGSAHGDGHP